MTVPAEKLAIPAQVTRYLRSLAVLSPVDRISEVIFGTIMALTFTGTLSIATAGREDVREMLIGALGCNTAWGIVDGVWFVLASMLQRKREATSAAEAEAVWVTAREIRGALGCFLLTFFSTLPIALPFAFISDVYVALRTSNGVALVMLFAAGYGLGKWAGFPRLRTGLSMLLLGLILTLITIELGG